MITLIHGDDKSKLYEKFNSLLEKNVPKTDVDLKKIPLEHVSDTLASNTLFDDKKTIVLKNLKSLHHTKRKKLFERLISSKKDKMTHIIILEESPLDKKVTAKIPYDHIFEFQLPKYFFDFLDSLAPKNAGRVSKLLTELSKSAEGEQLFYAAVNRTRAMLFFKARSPDEFKDIKKMSPYFKSKLSAQARKWDDNDLITFYRALFDIELGLKTSNLPLDIAKHLDIAVQKHLQ